jgi:hypothetical protein
MMEGSMMSEAVSPHTGFGAGNGGSGELPGTLALATLRGSVGLAFLMTGSGGCDSEQ